MTPIRYAAAACQSDLSNPIHRIAMRTPAPVFATVEKLWRRLAVPIPNEHPLLPGRRLTFAENEQQIEIAKARLDEHIATVRSGV